MIFREKGQTDTALAYCKNALTIDRQTGHRHGEAEDLVNIGAIYSKRGDLKTARECFDDALDICDEHGFRECQAVVLGNIGVFHLLMGNEDSALVFLHRGATILRTYGLSYGRANIEQAIAKIEGEAKQKP